MSPYPAPGRLARKWRKLRRDPVRFFADSPSPVLRVVGLRSLEFAGAVFDLRNWLGRALDARFAGAGDQTFKLIPVNEIVVEGDGTYRSIGEDPQFLIETDPPLRRGGWALLTIDIGEIDGELGWIEPTVYCDDGSGFRQSTAIGLPIMVSGKVTTLMRLPDRVKSIRLDPMARLGRFNIKVVTIQALTIAEALRYLMNVENRSRPEALAALMNPRRPRNVREGIPQHEYRVWIDLHGIAPPSDLGGNADFLPSVDAGPVFSIIMPVYNTYLPWLREAIESVLGQDWSGWQLCIVDDASTDQRIFPVLQEYAEADPRISVQRRSLNGGIAAASNDGLAMARGDWVVGLDHDDMLAPDALSSIAESIQTAPDAAIVYSDCDRLSLDGQRHHPYFKPDWNYELCLGQNMVNHLSAFRRCDMEAVGGYRAEYEGSQDWDLLLRVVESVDHRRIHHIHRVLYHWRSTAQSFSSRSAEKAWEAGRRAVADHLDRTGQKATVMRGATGAGHLAVRWALPENPPLVSIVIPTQDRLDLLKKCIDGLRMRTTYRNFEIVIVDNGSVEPGTWRYYDELQAGRNRVRILEEPGAFNFSYLCNKGVEQAKGEIYLLLNNDVEPIEEGWLSEMVAHALRPEVGAVGAKLYYPDGTIQHAGVIVGMGGAAGHLHKHLPGDSDGYYGRARLTQRLSAVTAACLAGRKSVYDEVGGFDAENLKVAFNDVDFCLRVGEAGYAVIWTPFAELRHHESASRGHDLEPQRGARYMGEVRYLQERWASILPHDPHYNSNLCLSGEELRLAFEPRVRECQLAGAFEAALTARKAEQSGMNDLLESQSE